MRPLPPTRAVLLAAGLLTAGSMAAMAQKNFDQPPQMSRAQPSRPPASPPPQSNTRFTLINNTDMVIDSLNISPVDDTEWGDDLLGTLSLPGHNRLIAGPAQDSGCMFDVRVVYHDHREEVARRQNLCDLQELAFTGRNARQPQRRHGSE